MYLYLIKKESLNMTKIISTLAVLAVVFTFSACAEKEAASVSTAGAPSAVPTTSEAKDTAVKKAVDVADKKTDGKASKALKMVK
jgi:hypothetical protein